MEKSLSTPADPLLRSPTIAKKVKALPWMNCFPTVPGQSGRRQQRKFSLTQSMHVHIWACSTSYSLWTKEKLSPELLLLAYLLRNCFACLLRTVFDGLNSTAKPRILASCVPCLIPLPFAIKSCINKPMPVPFFPVSALTRYYFLVLICSFFFFSEGKEASDCILQCKEATACQTYSWLLPFVSVSAETRASKKFKKKMDYMFPWPQNHWMCRAFFFSLLYNCEGCSPWVLGSFWEEWSMISLFIYCVLPLQCKSLLQVISLTVKLSYEEITSLHMLKLRKTDSLQHCVFCHK